MKKNDEKLKKLINNMKESEKNSIPLMKTKKTIKSSLKKYQKLLKKEKKRGKMD